MAAVGQFFLLEKMSIHEPIVFLWTGTLPIPGQRETDEQGTCFCRCPALQITSTIGHFHKCLVQQHIVLGVSSLD